MFTGMRSLFVRISEAATRRSLTDRPKEQHIWRGNGVLQKLNKRCFMIPRETRPLIPSGCSTFHTCSVFQRTSLLPREPKVWPTYNDIVYPPRGPDEPRRPAEYYQYRANVKVQHKKLFYITGNIRGMTVDEAIKQLSFMKRKAANIMKDIIEEAQEIAVRDHHMEYKSNMWIAEAYARRSKIIYGLRKHAGWRFGKVHYRYSHIFLCLREGKPPKHYHAPDPTGNEKMQVYLDDLRKRRIHRGL